MKEIFTQKATSHVRRTTQKLRQEEIETHTFVLIVLVDGVDRDIA